MTVHVDRRTFLAFLTAGGALVVRGAPTGAQAPDAARGFVGDVGPYLRINPDNTVVVGAPAPEIGTNMTTSIPMLIAEEVGLDWTQVTIRQMPIRLVRGADGRVRRPFGEQGGGGSGTLRGAWNLVRPIAAATRRLLLRAASAELGAPIGELRAENGRVLHDASGRSLPFSAIAARAAALSAEGADDAEPALKDPSAFSLVGRETPLVGVRDVVTGEARYGLDAEMDGMLHAVIARCPIYGGDVAALDDAAARAVPGVRDVITLAKPGPDDGYFAAGVAVLADSLWAAMKGRAALDATWEGDGAEESSAAMAARLRAALDGEGRTVMADGDVAAALAGAAQTVTADYALPMLSHAPMEPPNAVVRVGEDGIDVMTSGHSADSVVANLARASGRSFEDIRFTPSRTGGSFGRRLYTDMVIEAYRLAVATGQPVRVVWTREDDAATDVYRPMSAHRMRGGLDADGRLVAWSHHAALAYNWYGGGDEPHMHTAWPDNFPRRVIENAELRFTGVEWTPWNGYWRAPMPYQHAFVSESFMNELAAAADADPIAFRLSLLEPARDIPYSHYGGPTYNTGRLAACLRAVAEMADWEAPAPDGVGRGVAGYFTFGGYCAVALEASVSEAGDVRVSRAFVAADSGRVVNPNGFRAQLEGGLMDGLSTALRLKIDVENGRAVQSNFDRYQVMRIADAPPVVETRLIAGADEIHGAGEMAIPPTAPALCEAIFQATGRRIRSLPIGDQLRA